MHSSDRRVCRSGLRTRLPGARAELRAFRGPSGAARRWIGDPRALAQRCLAHSQRCTADSEAERSGLRALHSESSVSSSPPEKISESGSANVSLHAQGSNWDRNLKRIWNLQGTLKPNSLLLTLAFLVGLLLDDIHRLKTHFVIPVL